MKKEPSILKYDTKDSKDPDQAYTCIPNRILRDPTLSGTAKTVFGYVYGRQLDWKINLPDIVKHCAERIGAVRAAWDELRRHGYASSLKICDAGRRPYWLRRLSDRKVFERDEFVGLESANVYTDGGRRAESSGVKGSLVKNRHVKDSLVKNHQRTKKEGNKERDVQSFSAPKAQKNREAITTTTTNKDFASGDCSAFGGVVGVGEDDLRSFPPPAVPSQATGVLSSSSVRGSSSTKIPT